MRLKSKEHNEDLIKLIEKTLETKNAKGTRERVGTAIGKLSSDLACYHDSRFWDVPEKFTFPKSMLLKYS